MIRKILVLVRNSILLGFIVCISIGVCAGVIFAFDYLNSEGAFSTWKITNNLPAELSKIISADRFTIWVESEDRVIYSLNVLCSFQISECNKMAWTESNVDLASLPVVSDEENGQFLARKDTCDFADKFDPKYFQQPKGMVVECVRAYTLSPNGVAVTYYARMSNDEIRYRYVVPLSNFFELLFFATLIGLILGVMSCAFFYNRFFKK